VIRHVVTFRFGPGLPTGQLDVIDAALAHLAARLDVLREYHYGRHLGLPSGNADYAITALVDDEVALKSYLDDPEHRRVATELIDPHANEILAVQFTVPV